MKLVRGPVRYRNRLWGSALALASEQKLRRRYATWKEEDIGEDPYGGVGEAWP